MSDSVLSQEEINALLTGESGISENDDCLTYQQEDALGEIGNISMGTAATTLNSLLNQKVMITTPKVSVISWNDFVSIASQDLISISVDYVEGLIGLCVMMLKEEDVKVIADLMMGGDGTGINPDESISELHLSAIQEAMNQMIGSASTSMAKLFNKKIDISTPTAIKAKESLDVLSDKLGSPKNLVKVSFNMVVGSKIIDSELMQVLPIEFAKDLVSPLMQGKTCLSADTPPSDIDKNSEMLSNLHTGTNGITPVASHEGAHDLHRGIQMPTQRQEKFTQKNTNVQQAEFPVFDNSVMGALFGSQNLELLSDVKLEVTVELGRTVKKIKEVLDFNKGSVIELDRLVGEPVDILINGKFIAKGEVVVIDENFGIRITDINNPQK